MDGNCLLRAVLKCCDFVDEEEGKKYGHHQLRLQVIEHMVTYRGELFKELKEDIRLTYGALEDADENGQGYSYHSYLKTMCRDMEWCDQIIIKAISSMWGAKITVLNADTLYENKYRHDGDPQDADICLLYNGSYLHGHYLACVRTNGTNFLLGVPELAEGYNRVEDRIERRMRNDYMWAEEGDEEIMAIPVSLYASLLNKAEKYDQLIAKMKEVEGEPSRSTGGALPRLPQIPSNIGGGGDPPGPPPPPQGGSGAAKVRRDPGDPTTRKKGGSVYEAEKDFLPEELGNDVSVCPRCHLDQVTHSNLMSHVKKFHKDIYNFLCKKCDRGFMSKAGLNMHKATHKTTKIPCEVEGCETKCSTTKSLKQHMRIFHPEGGRKEWVCPFGDCGKTFQTKSNWQQHKKSCKKNTGRIELKCDICGKGKFYLLNKLQEHKRDNHKWR